MSDKTPILDAEMVEARLRRMAFEVYEQNFEETEIVVLGISERGGFIAKRIVDTLGEISSLEILYAQAELDKEVRQGRAGLMQASFSEEPSFFEGKVVLVVDDVLYSGNTLLNVIAPLLSFDPKKIQTAVLIDRGHRSMPIFSNIVGTQLATTLQDHVMFEVDEEGKAAAWLV
jgi:pyrimidine operon attenuation protein/uracil phosphoribosyltransferase